MTKKQSRKGYTLLETILAVGLSAILMALIAGGMRLYTQIVSSRRTEVTNAQVARAVLDQISKDLRAAYYDEEEEDESLAADGLDTATGVGEALGQFAGGVAGDTVADEPSDSSDLGAAGGSELGTSTADLTGTTVNSIPGIFGNEAEIRIDRRGNFTHPVRYDALVDAGADPLVANLLSVDRVVTYLVRPTDPSELLGTPLESASDVMVDSSEMTVLVRRTQKRSAAEYESEMGSTSTAGEQYLSDRVVGLQFEYHDGYGWTTTWDTEEMGGLPIAVRVSVSVADPMDADAIAGFYQTTVAIPSAVIPEDTSTTTEF